MLSLQRQRVISGSLIGVAADCNLTHLDGVKVDHLGKDGGFGTADADS
jgi:hypothetical protein